MKCFRKAKIVSQKAVLDSKVKEQKERAYPSHEGGMREPVPLGCMIQETDASERRARERREGRAGKDRKKGWRRGEERSCCWGPKKKPPNHQKKKKPPKNQQTQKKKRKKPKKTTQPPHKQPISKRRERISRERSWPRDPVARATRSGKKRKPDEKREGSTKCLRRGRWSRHDKSPAEAWKGPGANTLGEKRGKRFGGRGQERGGQG